jgi:hypothetical protein
VVAAGTLQDVHTSAFFFFCTLDTFPAFFLSLGNGWKTGSLLAAL